MKRKDWNSMQRCTWLLCKCELTITNKDSEKHLDNWCHAAWSGKAKLLSVSITCGLLSVRNWTSLVELLQSGQVHRPVNTGGLLSKLGAPPWYPTQTSSWDGETEWQSWISTCSSLTIGTLCLGIANDQELTKCGFHKALSKGRKY